MYQDGATRRVMIRLGVKFDICITIMTLNCMKFSQRFKKLKKETDEVFVIFNNNSGGHAAQNAKRFQKVLNINYESLTPKQLDFFEGEW